MVMDATARPMAHISEKRLYAVLTQLAVVTEKVGKPEFYRDLMTILGVRLRADLSMVMRYSRQNAPEYLIHDRLRPEHMEMYRRGLYRVDPIYRLCRNSSGRGVQDLARICTPAERSGAYFNIFLRITGMSDDLAILLPVDEESSIGIVYERRSPFLTDEITALRGLFPLIEGLHRLHQKLVDEQLGRSVTEVLATEGIDRAPVDPGLAPIDHKAALGAFLREKLTPRERDIVHLILVGCPSAKIAERLKLSVNTIKNHRKRMYLKLGIKAERELFLSFVGFLLSGRIGNGP